MIHDLASGFMPHGMCYLWQPGIITVMAVANGLIALAYYAIPILLLYFIGKRPDIPNPLLFTLFAVFILACGTSHLLEVVNIWTPLYWLTATVDGITALASVGTAAIMAPLMPRLLRSGTVEAYLESVSRGVLEQQNQALAAANARLETANRELSERMELMDRSARIMAEREERIAQLRAEVEQLRAQLGHPPA